MLTAKDYKDAIDVQDACNLSGVVFAYARVMKDICDEAQAKGMGTDWKNSHPISIMYASKIASLTKCEDTMVFSKAADDTEVRSKG